MMYVTFGMEKYPFIRLCEWIEQAIEDGVIKEDVIVQMGPTSFNFTSKNVTSVVNVDFDTMCKYIKDASYVIGHAGVGTFLTIAGLGKTPIIVPRYANKGEHIDEHQMELATTLEKVQIPVAYTYEDLVKFLSKKPEAIKLQSHRKELIEYLDSIV